MNNLAIFENEEFGTVRTMVIDENPWFVGKDICNVFGDKNHNRSLSRIDDCDRKIVPLETAGGKQNLVVVNESGLYALLFAMQPQKAHSEGVSDEYPLEIQERINKLRKFKHWVTSEVLPSIRKTGSYTLKNDNLPRNHSLSEVNDMIKIVNEIYSAAGVAPVFIASATKQLYAEQAGIPIPLKIEAEEEKLYDCTEIARELKIYSKSGKPHNKAVSAIIKKLCIADDLTVRTPFTRNGHSDFTTQYKQPVVEKIKEWLNENSYPAAINYTDRNGLEGTCYVTYGFDD